MAKKIDMKPYHFDKVNSTYQVAIFLHEKRTDDANSNRIEVTYRQMEV